MNKSKHEATVSHRVRDSRTLRHTRADAPPEGHALALPSPRRGIHAEGQCLEQSCRCGWNRPLSLAAIDDNHSRQRSYLMISGAQCSFECGQLLLLALFVVHSELSQTASPPYSVSAPLFALCATAAV